MADLSELLRSTHTELINGVLVVRSPQRSWHSRLVLGLNTALAAQAPDNVTVVQEMAVRLDRRNCPEPDILAATAPFDLSRTWFDSADVVLAVEVVSPESAHRDRTVKLHKYAEAGIAHYWLIENENNVPVAHVFGVA